MENIELAKLVELNTYANFKIVLRTEDEVYLLFSEEGFISKELDSRWNSRFTSRDPDELMNLGFNLNDEEREAVRNSRKGFSVYSFPKQ